MSVNHPTRALRRSLRGLARALLPPRCLVCAGPAAGEDLCAACRSELPLNRPACPSCALPLGAPAPACGACLRAAPPWSQLAAPWRYEQAIARLLPRFKFHHDLAAGRVLAERALIELASWPGWQGVDRVVPIPLHRDRLRQRGYNQALELARSFARARGLRLDSSCLQRVRATAAQTHLDAAARRRNLRRAFAAHPLEGGVTLLVDDVVTTTATVDAATRTLLRAGAAEVRVVALARAI